MHKFENIGMESGRRVEGVMGGGGGLGVGGGEEEETKCWKSERNLELAARTLRAN
jgi:hypothetical protein